MENSRFRRQFVAIQPEASISGLNSYAAGVGLAYVVATYIRNAHLVRVAVEQRLGLAALEDYGWLSVRTIGPAVSAAFHKCFLRDLVMAVLGVGLVVYNLRRMPRRFQRARERIEARKRRS